MPLKSLSENSIIFVILGLFLFIDFFSLLMNYGTTQWSEDLEGTVVPLEEFLRET